jgi:glycosyltransferase involved in cell wall biosynthesis
VQYHAPLFEFLAAYGEYDLKVFYTSGKEDGASFDVGFGKNRSWNIDLLKGYKYEFLNNCAFDYKLTSFFSIVNPGIIKKTAAYSPTLIIIFGWNYFSHLSMMLHYKGKIPVVFRGDSTSIDDSTANPLKVLLRYTILKWVYRYVDYVLSPGSASDTYFIKSGVTEKQIIRSPHAVDNFRFAEFSTNEYDSLNLLKERLNINPQNLVFLFAGKFIDKKNPLLLIQAFNKVALKHDNVRLVIVGDGILESTIKTQISSLTDSIANRIHLFPFQDQQNIKLFYRLASVFVLPSKGPGETWGLSVNEALASGMPVLVSSRCGCAHDLVQEGINGYLFKSDDLIDLERKMLLCCDEAHLKFLAGNAVQSVENFSFQSIKESLDNINTLIEK